MSIFYCLIVFLLVIFVDSSLAKEQNRNHAARYSNMLERLLSNTKPAQILPSENNNRCIPCLLKLYFDKTLQKTIERENRVDASTLTLPKTHKSLRDDYSPFGKHKANQLSYNKPSAESVSGLESSSSRYIAVKQLSKYSEDDEPSEEDEDVQNEIKDYEDTYVDDLTNDLSAYSAQSEYYESNEDVEEIDYKANPHEEMCKTRKTWKLLNETRNQKGQLVRVLPRTHEGDLQFVYIYECVHSECERCRGVDHNSRCRMRESYLNLYHEVNGVAQYGYVIVPTHCTCELLPHNFYPEGCSKNRRDRIRGK